MHAFLSSPIGIEAACREPALVAALCDALHGADAEGRRIVVEVLCKLSIYSAHSYSLALEASFRALHQCLALSKHSCSCKNVHSRTAA